MEKLKNSKDFQSQQNLQNFQGVQNSQNKRNSWKLKNSQNSKNYQGFENSQNSQDFQNSQHFQNPQNPQKEIRTKSGFVAFVLGLFLGFFGVDRFYKGDFWLGVLKFCTAGGFGLWWLIDLFIVPAAVSRGEYSHLSTPQRLFLGSFIAVIALSIILAKAQIHKEEQADTNPQIENSTLSF